MKTNYLTIAKKYSKIALILCAPIVLSNCGKDDVQIFPEANPLAGYLEASGFDEEEQARIDDLDWEAGISFIPTVSGQINAIVVELPSNRDNLKVTIWNKAAGTIYKTEIMNVEAYTRLEKEVTPITLEKDKEYIISMNTNDWFGRARTDGSATTYPIVVGDIRITGYVFGLGALQSFPTNSDNAYYAGDLSFIFQETAE